MTQSKWERYLSVHHPPALLRSEKGDGRRKEVRKVLSELIPDWDRKGLLLAPGCGDGFELDVLTEMGFTSITGITNDERELGDPRIVLGDMHDVDWPDGQFDYMYSKEVLEHTPAPYLCLREWNRIMRIGGQALHLISSSIEKQRDIYHFSCFPDWVWYDLFKKAGFKVLKIYEHPIQLGFLVEKVETDFDAIPKHYSYDLRGEVNEVPRETLHL